jgi:AcrR family transcriptional regulator
MVRMEPPEVTPSLRARKRGRTRQAIVDAATELFEERGYDGTTVADIAAAAEIGTRTFFSYFTSKEEVLFPESDARVRAAVDAIAARRPGDRAADVLLRGLAELEDVGNDMVGRLGALRVRMFRSVPAVRGHALQVQLEAEREIARHLHAAFADELDEVAAAALVGAFVGATSGALNVLLDGRIEVADPDRLRAEVSRVTAMALQPWREQAGRP